MSLISLLINLINLCWIKVFIFLSYLTQDFWIAVHQSYRKNIKLQELFSVFTIRRTKSPLRAKQKALGEQKLQFDGKFPPTQTPHAYVLEDETR